MRRVRCGRCGLDFRVRLEVVSHFHSCRPLAPVARARRLLGGDIDWPTAEDRRASVWTDFAGGTDPYDPDQPDHVGRHQL